MTSNAKFSCLPDNDLFRSAFNFASIGMALVGLDGTWLEVNDSVCRLTGYSRDELLKINFQKITHQDDLEKDLFALQQLIKGEIDHYEMEKRYFHKNAQIVWVLLTVSMVRDMQNEPLFFISQIQDITNRKTIELELRRRKTTLKSLLNNTQAIITRMNRQFEIVYINSAVKAFTGIEPDNFIGKKLSDFGNVIRYAKLYEKAAAEVFETGLECHTESERQVKGETAYFVTHVTPEFDEKGEIESALGVTFNVTKLKKTENELRGALAEIKQLQAILPICSYCKNIRDDKDYWQTVEDYLSSRTDTKFSHSICPDCFTQKVKPQLNDFSDKKRKDKI